MRKIKFLPDTSNIIALEAPENLTVGAFIELLQSKNGQFDLSKNLLTGKKSKASFLTSDSVLPEGDIFLFSTIKDPKGNVTSRADVYQKIKELKDTYGDYVKQHFGNYTQVATDKLEKLLKTFSKSEARKSLAKKPVAKTTATKTVAKKVVAKKTVSASKEDLELKAAQKSFAPKIYRNR